MALGEGEGFGVLRNGFAMPCAVGRGSSKVVDKSTFWFSCVRASNSGVLVWESI